MKPRQAACVLWGDKYDERYAANLWAMLQHYTSGPTELHVWTEPGRVLPRPLIHHALEPWDEVHGPRRGWWYKMQLFDSARVLPRMVYFDLDVVLTDMVDWLWELDATTKFWSVRDFRYLWRRSIQTINSSVMVWDPERWHWIWQRFCDQDVGRVINQYRGDQDFLAAHISESDRAWLDPDRVRSWRWQCFEGGMDFHTRRGFQPGSGTHVPPGTAILVFHGSPKPHEVNDTVIREHWHLAQARLRP